MIPYLICFAASGILCCCGERYLNNKRNNTAYILFAAAVLVPAVMAGIRGFNIGTDIWTYGNGVFQSAVNSGSFRKFWTVTITHKEPLYIILNYVLSLVTDNVHWLYFAIGIIIYGFFMAGLMYYRDDISITMAWMCFLGFYIGDTFNAMRQFMALSIVFWGFHYATQKKYLKFLIALFAACMFQYTALISVLVLLIYFLIKRWPYWRTIIIMAAVVIVGMIIYKPALTGLISTGVIPERYQQYIYGGGSIMPASFKQNMEACVFWLPGLLLACIQRDKFLEFKGKYRSRIDGLFLITMLVMDVAVFQYRSIIFSLYRFSFFFGIFKPAAYGRIIKINGGIKKKILIVLLIILLLADFWVRAAHWGENEVYPFKSDIISYLLK